MNGLQARIGGASRLRGPARPTAPGCASRPGPPAARRAYPPPPAWRSRPGAGLSRRWCTRAAKPPSRIFAPKTNSGHRPPKPRRIKGIRGFSPKTLFYCRRNIIRQGRGSAEALAVAYRQPDLPWSGDCSRSANGRPVERFLKRTSAASPPAAARALASAPHRSPAGLGLRPRTRRCGGIWWGLSCTGWGRRGCVAGGRCRLGWR